ncbi:MAG: hypothetical protein ABIR57_11265 [Aeromicrobium sp.]
MASLKVGQAIPTPSRADPHSRWPWLLLALAATAVAGLPGHTVPWFTGDLAYHLAVSRTMSDGHFNGLGPYDGLPAYFGGAYSLLLSLPIRAGMDPRMVVTVVSWFEPALWVAGCAYLGSALWRGSRSTALIFTVLVLFGAGVWQTNDELSVNAPSLSGQVFWPLYPRDVALILMMFAIGLGLRRRWLLGGVVAGIAVATQAQIAVVACILLPLALVFTRMPRRWRSAFGALAVAAVVSSWWWIPRLFWTIDLGLEIKNSPTWADLDKGPETILRTYGVLLPFALAGVVTLVRNRRSSAPGSAESGFLLAWVVLGIATIITPLFLPGELLAFRRSLLLATFPMAAAAAVGIVAVCAAIRAKGVRIPAFLVTACVLLVSVPTLVRTHSIAHDEFESEVFARMEYPNAQWAPVWKRVDSAPGPFLTPERDAAMAWFRSGQPQVSIPRPGFLKAGFDIGQATGWPESERHKAAEQAFAGGRRALCSLIDERGIHSVMLRSQPGLIGTLDIAGPSATPTGGADALALIVVPRRGHIAISRDASAKLRVVHVWQAGRRSRPAFVLNRGGHVIRPKSITFEGTGIRFEFDIPVGAGELTVVNETGSIRRLIRIVGYEPFPVSSGPASVVSAAALCRAGTPAGPST